MPLEFRMPFDFETVAVFQGELFQTLRARFDGAEVTQEWCSLRGKRKIYQPKVDIAVGPFSTVAGGNQTQEHRELLEHHRELVERIIALHVANVHRFCNEDVDVDFESVVQGNTNARCSVAIEIEHRGSRKHHLGDYVNAGALGRLGLIVAWNDTNLTAFLRIWRYFEFLRGVNKRTFVAPNVVVVRADQLWGVLQ